MACCPCGGGATCTCPTSCDQCGTCQTTWFWNLVLSGFTGAGCTGLNTTWKLCIVGPCFWQATSGSIQIILQYLSLTTTWQLKISTDSGSNFTYFTTPAASFNCTTDNTLTFDHSDAGFTCGGIPASVTVSFKGQCCNVSLSTCCCSFYPQKMRATITQTSGGCASLNNFTVDMQRFSFGCTDPGNYVGVAPVTIAGFTYCVTLEIACGFPNPGATPCEMSLIRFNICQHPAQADCGNLIDAEGQCNSGDTCDRLDAAVACASTPCADPGCVCDPFLLTFTGVVLDDTLVCDNTGVQFPDPLCDGTYKIVITGV